MYLRALAIAVHHADDILAAPLVGPDDHQDALLVMVHARREIDISLGRQVALSPSFILVPPQRLQPGNGARRKARSIPPHKRGKGLAEIAARDPLQSPGPATDAPRPAECPSEDHPKMILADANQQLYRLSWRIPCFGKPASSINARIRHLQTPSPRFSYSSLIDLAVLVC